MSPLLFVYQHCFVHVNSHFCCFSLHFLCVFLFTIPIPFITHNFLVLQFTAEEEDKEPCLPNLKTQRHCFNIISMFSNSPTFSLRPGCLNPDQDVFCSQLCLRLDILLPLYPLILVHASKWTFRKGLSCMF